MPQNRKVILLSVDGLRADLCQRTDLAATTLQSLRAQGLSAERALSVYPTVTFTNHASIATGLHSKDHGILGNTTPSTRNGKFRDWMLNESAFKAPTLWGEARKAGRSVALLRWPSTTGARANINVPELFDPLAEDDAKSWQLALEHSTKWFTDAVTDRSSIKVPTCRLDYDRWVTDAITYLLNDKCPDLIMAHFVGLDHEQHEHGCESRETYEALRFTDSLLGEIVSNVNFENTNLLVFGDHGMTDFTRRFSINALFVQKGWITLKNGLIESWRAMAHINCGQAAVYVSDPFVKRDVLNALHEISEGCFEVLNRSTLSRLGAFPDALCAVDCLPGYSMSENLTGSIFTSIEGVRGDHGQGYLSSHPNMQAGFIAVGPDFTRGTKLKELRLTEVAPMTASMLKFTMPMLNDSQTCLRSSRV